MENGMEGPQKAKNRTTIWSSNSTAGYLSKGNKTLIRKDACTPMFTVALFTTAKICEQPMCSPINRWIDKEDHTHTHTLDYYSVIKKNEILPFVTSWMDLEGITLNEISQTKKDKYCMISLICEI